MSDDASIKSVLSEDRVFYPPDDFAERCGGAWIESMEEYQELHAASIADPENFWSTIANELDWFEPWTQVLDWQAPDAKWFVNGKTNACHNCLDRLIRLGHGDEVALTWEAEPVGDDGPEIRTFTYRELHAEVCRFANGLKSIGVGRFC